MAGLPTVAAPASGAGQADPREALYWSTAAELGHQYEHTLASDQEALENAKTSLLAGQGKLDRAEPLQLAGIRNRANAEGILSSGIEAQRTGTQQAGYLTARNQLQTGFQQQQNRINRANSEAGQSYTDKMSTNLAGAESRQQAEAEKQAASNPTLGGQMISKGTEGVNLNLAPAQRTSPASRTPDVRRAAAQRITGRPQRPRRPGGGVIVG